MRSADARRRAGQPTSQGPIWVQGSSPSSGRPSVRSTGHQCQPSRSNAPAKRRPQGPTVGSVRRALRRCGAGGIAGDAGQADLRLVQLEPGREVVVVDRPVLADAVERSHAEVLGPEARHVRRPPDRAAADRVPDHRADRAFAVVDRLVLVPLPDVGVGVQARAAAQLEVGRVAGVSASGSNQPPRSTHSTSRPCVASRQAAAAPVGPSRRSTMSASMSDMACFPLFGRGPAGTNDDPARTRCASSLIR